MLAYTHGNRVAPFLEPVLELCAALLVAYSPARGGRPSPFGPSAAQGAISLTAPATGWASCTVLCHQLTCTEASPESLLLAPLAAPESGQPELGSAFRIQLSLAPSRAPGTASSVARQRCRRAEALASQENTSTM